MSKSAWKMYRHSKTGLPQRMHPQVASADPNLVEVSEKAKRLAYKKITPAAVAQVLASKTEAKSGEPVGEEKE